jgi:hypothetical protein
VLSIPAEPALDRIPGHTVYSQLLVMTNDLDAASDQIINDKRKKDTS